MGRRNLPAPFVTVIVTNFTYGLGNQLFQYATGYALASLNNTEHVMDIVSGLSVPRESNHIYLFSPESREASFPELLELSNVFSLSPSKLADIRYDEDVLRSLDPKLVIESGMGYEPSLRSNRIANGYLLGYWQSYLYFEDCIDDLRRQFQLRQRPLEQTQRLAETIQQSNSISMHVRRGDYLKPAHASFHGNLTIDYYAAAIDLIAKRTERASVYVFSDDIAWTKTNSKFSIPTIFVDHTSAATAHEDLYLMTLCRHSIVANSTFSWWGAWLSKRDGIRIAPRRWFAIEKLNQTTETLIPKTWERI